MPKTVNVKTRNFGQELPPKGPTYKLKFFKEYTGDKLTETILRKHGLKPNGLQNAICNNKPFLDHIQSMF
ncbi:MAG: hypothetical protein LKH27_05650 [Prevotella sp.]|jgi:hypothetical protein|nr:hypothetical protein [Prevotella sp.]MCH3992552.1 hypothetical protein [Prevotella sp.]MCI1473875.1 hypothetical protein [Prevotella sp.]